MITHGRQSAVEHNVMCSSFIIKTAQAEPDNIWKILQEIREEQIRQAQSYVSVSEAFFYT